VLAEGDSEPLGDKEALVEELGLKEALGDKEALTLAEELGESDKLALALGDREAETEAEGERLTPKDCIQINQLVELRPSTFLNSYISPKTLPVGWGP